MGRVLAELPQGSRLPWSHRMLWPWRTPVAEFKVGAAAAFSLLVLLVLDVHGGSETAFGGNVDRGRGGRSAR